MSLQPDLASRTLTLTPEAREQVSTDSAALREVYGARWVFVPHGLGDAAQEARDVLGHGLIPIDIDRSDPLRVTQEVGAFAEITARMTTKITGNAVLVGEALRVDLCALPLRRLRRACRAVAQLATAPPFPSSWSVPSAAQTASLVLGALGEDLRTLADVRRELYEEFTEDVWTVSGRRVTARAEFAAVTRSGRPPVDAKHSLVLLRRAREVNTRIETSWNAVSGYLGHFASQGIPDVDGARAALTSVMDLQRSLGDALDQAALRALATADAFVADELWRPAQKVVAAVDGWELRANRFGGFDPTGHSTAELAAWSKDVATSIDTLTVLIDATAPLRASVRTAGHILDDAIRRDRVQRLCEATTPTAVSA